MSKRELIRVETPTTWGNHHWEYGNFIIERDYVGYRWAVKDWDLDDPRIGNGKTVEECVAEIDDLEDES